MCAVSVCLCLSFPSLFWALASRSLLLPSASLTVDSALSSLVLIDFGFCPRTQPGTQTCYAILTPQMVKQTESSF